MDCPENTYPQDEDDTDADDLISNLDRYPDSEGNIEKGNEDTNSEGNTKQSKAGIEGDQAFSKEKEDHSAKTVSPIIGEEKRKEPVLNDDSTGAPQDGQMEMEKNNDNVGSPPIMRLRLKTLILCRGVPLSPSWILLRQKPIPCSKWIPGFIMRLWV